MTYFLDFDRTLFDTSAFLTYIIERENLSHLMSLSEVEMAVELNSITANGLLTFAPGELERFIYPDAVVFLKKNLASSVVVTAGNVALQKAKLESTFHKELPAKIFYTGEERKGPFLKGLLDSFPAPWSFVDDKPMELESVAKECPDIQLYEIRRDEKAPAGTFSIIHSFDELP